MNSTKKPKTKPVASFPKLVKSRTHDIIILAIGGGTTPSTFCGVIVHIGKDADNLYSVGYYSADWTTVSWEDYDGEIVLSN